MRISVAIMVLAVACGNEGPTPAVRAAPAVSQTSQPAVAGDKVAIAHAWIGDLGNKAFVPWLNAYPLRACPDPAAELLPLMGTGNANDPWGQPYRMTCDPSSAVRAVRVVSNGPDGKPNTDDDVEGTVKATEPPAVAVAATKLFDDYQENEVSADVKYKGEGKVLRVTGTVLRVSKVLGDPVVELATSNEAMPAYAGFASETALVSLKSGQQVTVRCRGKGLSLGHVLLDACVLQ